MEPPLTQLLQRVRDGDEAALAELFPLIYDELRRVAEREMRGERAGHTLQATALVNEAFLKLVGSEQGDWESKAHFVNAAGRAMRQILVDHARARKRLKRGGGARQEPLDTSIIAPSEPGGAEESAVDIEALDAALTKLSALDERQARLVELRYFCGLTEPEAAKALGVSQRTAASDWAFAKAWLRNELSAGTGSASEE